MHTLPSAVFAGWLQIGAEVAIQNPNFSANPSRRKWGMETTAGQDQSGWGERQYKLAIGSFWASANTVPINNNE